MKKKEKLDRQLPFEENQKAWEFFSQFDRFTLKQKEMWKVICWYYNKYPCAFPTQTKIANTVLKNKRFEKCSRVWVNKTIQRFIGQGWMWLESRGKRRAKIIHITRGFEKIHLIDRMRLRNPKVTTFSTRSSYSNSYGYSDGSFKIEPWVNKNLSFENKLKASLFPEYIYAQTVEELARRKKPPNIVDEQAYFIGALTRKAKKLGVKIRWKRFYALFDCAA